MNGKLIEITRQPSSSTVLLIKTNVEWTSILQLKLFEISVFMICNGDSARAFSTIDFFSHPLSRCGQNFESINGFHLSIGHWTLNSLKFFIRLNFFSQYSAFQTSFDWSLKRQKFNNFKDISHFNQLMSVTRIFSYPNLWFRAFVLHIKKFIKVVQMQFRRNMFKLA